MKYFDTYVSNTTAGSANQHFFGTDENVQTGRVYYKIFCGGRFEYSLLYSNTIDSTFADGRDSACNKVCDEWEIVSLRVGRCAACDMHNPCDPESFVTVTFSGDIHKTVNPGELFCTDPFTFEAQNGEYMCIEISFRGKMIPHHREFQMASFRKKSDGTWRKSVHLPYPSMVGCNRKVKAQIGFLGDSITQGIGSTQNSYRHWNSVVADNLGTDYAFWNLGIGYGRAADAASDGMWLYKAKQNRIVVLCMGVNDISRCGDCVPPAQSLEKIITKLKDSGCKVIIQSIPPFDFADEKYTLWKDSNRTVEEELSKIADGYFCNLDFLTGKEKDDGKAVYGGHPNDEGSKIWGENLAQYLSGWLAKNRI